MNGTGEGEAEVGCRRKVYAQGGTGDSNQALAARGWAEGLGSGLHRGDGTWQGEGPRLGECRGPVEKPDPGLRISDHLVPTLIPCLLNLGTKNGLAGPPFLLG